MAVSCSFKAIVDSPCSHDRRDQSKSVNEVPLLSWVKDTERHKSLWSFTGVTGEKELILLRAAIFTTQQDISNLIICPFHRSELGLVENAAENMQGKKQFAKFKILQIEEGEHVYVIYTFVLYRHERFTAKYTTRKIHKKYIWDPRAKWFIFRNLTREFNHDVSSVYLYKKTLVPI